MMRVVILLCLVILPGPALAFCGGWDSPVAPGFDGASWGDRWPVLAAILTFVAIFSTFIIHRVRSMRDLPEEV